MVVCLVLALYMLLGMTVHASEDDTRGDVIIQNLSGNGGLLQCYKDGETELYFSEAIPKGVNTFTVEDLEQGSYYLEIKGGVALYEPMKFSVISSYDSEANVYTTDDVTIQAKYTMPGVSKLADRQSAKVGDRVTYTLQIDIPQYLDTEENKLFKISDMPSEGLEIAENTIQFYACDAEYQKIGEALPVTDMIEIAMIPGLGMELTMTDYKAFCNLVGSTSVILEYQAVVNQYVHGGKSTENYATLTYDGGEDSDFVNLDTYVIRITKKAEDETVLTGATFSLLQDGIVLFSYPIMTRYEYAREQKELLLNYREQQTENSLEEPASIEQGPLGYLEIPRIKEHLPIYETTDESYLRKGVGLLEGSSMIGSEEGGHSVLCGHAGFAEATLFSRLTEMECGDMFHVYIGDKVMTYEVNQILIVKPEEQGTQEALKPQAEKDFVTLLTCTPPGQNTHRLIVRGERK